MKKAVIGLACLAILSPLANANEAFSTTSTYKFKEAILLEAGTEKYDFGDLGIGQFEDLSDYRDREVSEVGKIGKVRCELRGCLVLNSGPYA